MSYITTLNPFIVNVLELQSVLQTATGKVAAADTVQFTEYINTTTNTATFNSIGSYNSGKISVTNDVYLSNANIYVNDSPVIVGNNTINGNLYTAINVNNQEIARFNSNGLNIQTNGNGSGALFGYNKLTSNLEITSTKDFVVNASSITLKTDTYIGFDRTSILVHSAGASTCNYLRVKINGTYYKIGLFEDV